MTVTGSRESPPVREGRGAEGVCASSGSGGAWGPHWPGTAVGSLCSGSHRLAGLPCSPLRAGCSALGPDRNLHTQSATHTHTASRKEKKERKKKKNPNRFLPTLGFLGVPSGRPCSWYPAHRTGLASPPIICRRPRALSPALPADHSEWPPSLRGWELLLGAGAGCGTRSRAAAGEEHAGAGALLPPSLPRAGGRLNDTGTLFSRLAPRQPHRGLQGKGGAAERVAGQGRS